MSDLSCGDWVFVHPDDAAAPREVRGLAGKIEELDLDRATVEFRLETGTFSADVEASILRPERRRRNRPPARWSSDDLAATG